MCLWSGNQKNKAIILDWIGLTTCNMVISLLLGITLTPPIVINGLLLVAVCGYMLNKFHFFGLFCQQYFLVFLANYSFWSFLKLISYLLGYGGSSSIKDMVYTLQHEFFVVGFFETQSTFFRHEIWAQLVDRDFNLFVTNIGSNAWIWKCE